MLIRDARRTDVPAIVALLADDFLGSSRDSGEVGPEYLAAFDAIAADDRNVLVVAERDGEVIGTMQITYLPSLSRHGAERAQLEAVRVRSDVRGGGLGRQLIDWAVAQAAARGCRIVQLTTDKRRTDAQRFYASLGFVASHEGMKLDLD